MTDQLESGFRWIGLLLHNEGTRIRCTHVRYSHLATPVLNLSIQERIMTEEVQHIGPVNSSAGLCFSRTSTSVSDSILSDSIFFDQTPRTLSGDQPKFVSAPRSFFVWSSKVWMSVPVSQ